MNGQYRSQVEQEVRRQARPQHKFGHQPRMYALCRLIGETFSYDDDVVFAAAWLHDLGVFEGNRPDSIEQLLHWDHLAFARKHGVGLLLSTDFPKSKITQVEQVINEHQAEDEPTSIESEIVRDADILEQLGAIGILRTVSKLGSDTRFMRFTDAASHLKHQLEFLPSRLRLTSARKLAEPKIAALASFLSALDAESVPTLY